MCRKKWNALKAVTNYANHPEDLDTVASSLSQRPRTKERRGVNICVICNKKSFYAPSRCLK